MHFSVLVAGHVATAFHSSISAVKASSILPTFFIGDQGLELFEDGLFLVEVGALLGSTFSRHAFSRSRNALYMASLRSSSASGGRQIGWGLRRFWRGVSPSKASRWAVTSFSGVPIDFECGARFDADDDFRVFQQRGDALVDLGFHGRGNFWSTGRSRWFADGNGMRDSRCSFVAVGSDLDVSSKIRNWCARAERSPEQVRKKLHDWGAGDQSDRWIAALQEEDYVNPKRFAQAFVHDHLEFRNWGPAKIMSALTQVHRISRDQVRGRWRNGEGCRRRGRTCRSRLAAASLGCPRQRPVPLWRKGFSIGARFGL